MYGLVKYRAKRTGNENLVHVLLHATDLSLQKHSFVRDEATSPVYAAAPPTSGVSHPGRRRQNDAVREISSSTPEPTIAITQPMYRAARL